MYDKLIAQAIENTDEATVRLVEELMRLNERGPLDHLEPVMFELAARQAHGDAVILARCGELERFCGALQIKVPELT